MAERSANGTEADRRQHPAAQFDVSTPMAPEGVARPRATEGSSLSLPSAGDIEQLVRAHGSTFVVTDRQGDISPSGAREVGLFHRDTRHLSYYALTIKNALAVCLSSEAVGDAYNQIDLMLSDLEVGEFLDDPKNFLHIRRRQLLDAGLNEQIHFTNFLQRTVELDATLAFCAD